MKSSYLFIAFSLACLLATACSTTTQQQIPDETSELMLGPWLRDITGFHEVDGYLFVSGGELQLLNIFSMQADSWHLTENKLTILTHTERYPTPEPSEYTIEFISADSLHLGMNGHKTIYHRPRYVTELLNTRWVPLFIPQVALKGQTEKEPFLQFTAGGSVKGFAGCNHFSSSYSTKMSQLTVSPILTTKMYCPNMQYENVFLGALSGSNNYLIVEDQLYLFKEKVMQGAFKAMYYQ